MAEFVDINSLNDKNVLSGNEKLQVSELEYTTIAHIRDYIKNYFINTNAFLRNSNFMYVNTNNSGSNVMVEMFYILQKLILVVLY